MYRTRSTASTINMVSLLFAFVGIAFIVVSLVLVRQQAAKHQRCFMETTGTIMGFKEYWSRRSDGFRSYTYHPIVSYTVGTETITVTDTFGSDPPAFEEGEIVTVKYNPNDIQDYYIEGMNAPKLLYFIFGILGSVLLFISVVLTTSKFWLIFRR